MATYLSSLLERIPEKTLRDAISAEIRLLSDRQKFGLVFEKHIPEFVALPDHVVLPGRQVEKYEDPEANVWVVSAINGDQATIVRKGESEDVTEVFPVDSLTVVQTFADPIYPGLVLHDSCVTDSDSPNHLVINGENFHALQTLAYSHRQSIDVIYIDPPYNTGNTDWIYNDKYVEPTDAFRHSKWLSFMERRLKIAKDLLTPSGVIIVAIGDAEHHHLRMLLDSVFGSANFLANLTWQGRGKNDAKFTGGGQDYMLVYGQDKTVLSELGVKWIEPKPGAQEMIDLVKAIWDEQMASGVNAQKASLEATKHLKAHIKKYKTKLSGGLRQYNKVDENGLIFREGPLFSPTYSESLIYEFKHPITGEVFETPENGWRASFETMQEWIATGEVVFGADHRKQPTRKLVLDTKTDQVPLPTFEADRDSATKHLERLLGQKRFPNPKSHEVLERWLSIIASSDAVILDFFAGSGTTAEAVIRLNDLDGGKRRCILVTNNELSQKSAKQLKSAGLKPGDDAWESQGVYRYVTMPRIKSLLTGVRPDGSKHGDPLPGNAYFMDLKYLDSDLVSLGKTLDSLSHLLWLKAGATGLPLDLKQSDSFALAEDSNYAVLLNAGVWRKAISELSDKEHIRHLFVVTDSDSVFQQVSSEVSSRIETTMLYEDYISNFQVTVG